MGNCCSSDSTRKKGDNAMANGEKGGAGSKAASPSPVADQTQGDVPPLTSLVQPDEDQQRAHPDPLTTPGAPAAKEKEFVQPTYEALEPVTDGEESEEGESQSDGEGKNDDHSGTDGPTPSATEPVDFDRELSPTEADKKKPLTIAVDEYSYAPSEAFQTPVSLGISMRDSDFFESSARFHSARSSFAPGASLASIDDARFHSLRSSVQLNASQNMERPKLTKENLPRSPVALTAAALRPNDLQYRPPSAASSRPPLPNVNVKASAFTTTLTRNNRRMDSDTYSLHSARSAQSNVGPLRGGASTMSVQSLGVPPSEAFQSCRSMSIAGSSQASFQGSRRGQAFTKDDSVVFETPMSDAFHSAMGDESDYDMDSPNDQGGAANEPIPSNEPASGVDGANPTLQARETSHLMSTMSSVSQSTHEEMIVKDSVLQVPSDVSTPVESNESLPPVIAQTKIPGTRQAQEASRSVSQKSQKSQKSQSAAPTRGTSVASSVKVPPSTTGTKHSRGSSVASSVKGKSGEKLPKGSRGTSVASSNKVRATPKGTKSSVADRDSRPATPYETKPGHGGQPLPVAAVNQHPARDTDTPLGSLPQGSKSQTSSSRASTPNQAHPKIIMHKRNTPVSKTQSRSSATPRSVTPTSVNRSRATPYEPQVVEDNLMNFKPVDDMSVSAAGDAEFRPESQSSSVVSSPKDTQSAASSSAPVTPSEL